MQRQGIIQRVKILKILNKHKFISGQDIASICHISRIAVWKHINYLIENGVKIKVHANKGYEFLDFGYRLLPEIIKLHRDENSFIKDIIYFDDIDSTNEYAKRILKEGTLVIAEQQKKGKGRRGSKWYSEKYKDILFSLILSPKIPYSYLSLFNIIGTLAVAYALNKLFKLNAQTKWPNDVVINNKKCGGVLIEFVAELDLIDKLILGIGVNTNSKPKFKNSTSLSIVLRTKVDRMNLLVQILKELEIFYNLILRKRNSQIQKIWKEYAQDYEKRIKIIDEAKEIEGVSCGIDNFGNLILKRGDNYQIFYPTSLVIVK